MHLGSRNILIIYIECNANIRGCQVQEVGFLTFPYDNLAVQFFSERGNSQKCFMLIGATIHKPIDKAKKLMYKYRGEKSGILVRCSNLYIKARFTKSVVKSYFCACERYIYVNPTSE